MSPYFTLFVLVSSFSMIGLISGFKTRPLWVHLTYGLAGAMSIAALMLLALLVARA